MEGGRCKLAFTVSAPGKTILLVEDDGVLREEIASVISHLGVRVLQAADGVEGLAHLASGSVPAAILLDMKMPRLDGGGFLAALRDEPAFAACAEVPVVTMTGDGEAQAADGVASQLRKPFDVDELARILVSLCNAEP
jgi:CheY-like chemotaxis protein